MITSRVSHRADPNRRFRLHDLSEYKLDVPIFQIVKTGDCDWEELPPEVQVQILLDVSSLQDLFSLIRASPRYYQVFLTAREKILTTVVPRDVGSSLLGDAIYAARACLMDPRRSGVPDCGEFTTTKSGLKIWNRKPRQTEVSNLLLAWEKRYLSLGYLSFAEETKRARKEPPHLGPRPVNIDEAITICQIQRSVKFLTADYSLRARVPETKDSEDLQRAYYRFAMFDHLFHTVPVLDNRNRPNPGDPNAQRFLWSFPPADVNTFNEIHNDILHRLTNICYRIDQYLKDPLPNPDFEAEVRTGRGDDPFDGFSRKFTKYDCFCKSYASLPLRSNLRNMVSMGLGVVSRVLEAHSQIGVDPVIINGLPCCSEFVTTALRLSN